ncbi:hypothetical protein EON82_16885 [bacterium]|nr:MAG: hypothetical protein EON82_16885 [bacterium]
MLLLQAFVLLPQAHAHNDYAHPRPLLDALDQGFLSVEADIYFVDGELRVGHDRKDLKPGRTLESLYLDPLAQRVRKNKGTVYGQPGILTLLVDIKEDGPAVQSELTRRLPKYRAMLSERTGSTVQARAVQIVLSGARTADCAAGDGFLFKDGRPKDLADDSFRTPLISESYETALGTSLTPLPAEARAKLDELVRRTHAVGKRLRLWGTPDGPVTWGELRAAGLDLINTDRLAELRAYLLVPSKISK